MPVEQDDEVTVFETKPWGARQRVLPDARFIVRTSGPLQGSSVAPLEPLPTVRPPAPPAPPARVPAATPPRPISAAPVAQTAYHPAPAYAAQATYRGYAAPMMMPPGLPAAVTRAPITAFTPATALPLVPGAMPMHMVPAPLSHLPLAAFGPDVDCTLRVRRRPLTRRSLIAAPIGALAAILVILLATAGSNKKAAAATSARPIVVEPIMPTLAPIAEQAATAAVVVAEPAPEEMPTIVMDTEAPIPPLPALGAPSRKAAAKSRRRAPRPRKIIAVDASTPLGNLRPSKF